MSLSKDDMFTLMQFADGELPGDEAKAIAARLAKDADAAKFVSALGVIGDHVRLAGDEAGDRVASFDVADLVMAKIDDAKPAKSETEKVEKSAKIAAKSEQAAVGEKKGDLRSLEAARAERTRRTATVVAVLALAAAALVWVKTKGEQTPTAVVSPQDSATVIAPAATAPVPPLASVAQAPSTPASAPAGVAVNAVESDPAHAVSVFYLSGDNGATSSVAVWVDDSASAGAGGK